MMLRLFAFIFVFLLYSPAKSSSFSEVFGSEGAAGIENAKTRNLSYTLQYSTLAGSIGYVLKNLHDTGFFEPLGFTPNSFQNLSPLAYKKNFLLDKHSANIISVKQKVDKINYFNDLKLDITKKRFSTKVIEMRNNSNFSNSVMNYNNRSVILERYLEK